MFELCLQLGVPHPDHLLQVLSSAQVTDWLAFAELRPFGFVRESMLFGSLMAQQHVAHFKGRARAWYEFMPIPGMGERNRSVVTDAQAVEMFKAYNEARGYSAEGR